MYVLIGLIIGFIAAIPVGPVNVYVISQTMKRDFFHGLMAGVTTAVLDTTYCLIALIGVSQITFNLNKYLSLMKALAAFVLLILAFRLARHSRKYKSGQILESKVGGSFSAKSILGVVALYVSNPSLYFFWLGIAGLVTSHSWVMETGVSPFLFALSCGAGGFLWYLIVTRYVATKHHQFSPKTFRRIFEVMSIILFVLALYTLVTIFYKIKLL
jgi:L-lysine exporter family protein LysE/ArgO